MKKQISLLVFVLLLFGLFHIPPAQGGIYYSLTVTNNIGVSASTLPADSQCPIGYLGETHPSWPGSYAVQDIYAFAPDGYLFSHWSGDVPPGSETSALITVTMDRNRTVNAHFTANVYRKITTRGYIHSSPLLYDINHDGKREIIVGDMAGYVYCFDFQGNKLWDYYAGDAFDKTASPVPEWLNPEVKNNDNVGNVTVQSSCAAGDIDGDAMPDIIVGLGGWVESSDSQGGGTTAGFGPVGQGGILILNGDGTLKLLVRTWDTYDGLGNGIQDGFSDGVYSTPAIADLNKDGRLDFVVGGTDQNIYAYQTVGRDVTRGDDGQTKRFFHPPGYRGCWVTPIHEADNDGDGRFNEDPAGDCTPLTFYNTLDEVAGYDGRDDDGDGLVDEGAAGDDDEDSSQQVGYIDWGWVDEDEFEWPFRALDTIVSSPACADVDGDGYPEIVIGGDSAGGNPLVPGRKYIPPGGAIRVMNRFAEEIDQFPRWIEQTIFSSPSLVDFEGNGDIAIFHGTGTYYFEGTEWAGKGLYAFSADGTAYGAGTPSDGLFAATTNIIWGAPAFGDITGDGVPEVVAADFSGYLYAWDQQGYPLPGFPMLPHLDAGIPGDHNVQIRSSPILVDIDDDHIAEIVLGVGWSIVAVNGDGSIVPEFMYLRVNFTTGTAPVFATPAAVDLDNNGRIDLVWVTGDSPDGGATVTNGVIHVWELGNFNSSANPWPSFKRTGTRRSAYTLVVENPVFSPRTELLQEGSTLTASIEAYPGSAPVSSVVCRISVNGGPLQISLVDNGTGGDAVAGDGRYTGVMQLPPRVDTIEDVRFIAAASNGKTVNQAVGTYFTRINTRNLIRRYYRDILDREPDLPGLDAWSSEIERMTSLGADIKEGFVALAKFFLNSEEYLVRNKGNAAYILDLYQTFCNRAPAQAESDFWVAYLDQGLARNVIMNFFAYSVEFGEYLAQCLGIKWTRPEGNLVNDFYRGFLNRLPDSPGFNYWAAMMQSAQCAGATAVRNLSYEIVKSYLQSPEYAMRNRSNREYVEDLYNGILRRGAQPGEFDYWCAFLDAGTLPRYGSYHVNEAGEDVIEQMGVLEYFITSKEFQLKVKEIIDCGCSS